MKDDDERAGEGAVGGSPESVARPKLMDQLREALRSRHYSRRTEQTYCHWVWRFVHFHKFRHPAKMVEPEINAYLSLLAVNAKVSASTQNQVLSALLFLCRHVIGRTIGDLGGVIRARRFTRLPVVMAGAEVTACYPAILLSITVMKKPYSHC